MKHMLIKLLRYIFTLLFVSVVIFIAVHASGDPVQSMLGVNASEEQRAALTQKLGLDQPLPAQYGKFISNAVMGDLGNTHSSGRPVLEVIGEKLPNTIWLAVFSLFLAIFFTVVFGTLGAVYRGRRVDKLVGAFSALGQSCPVFFLAIIAVQLLGVKLRVFPVSGADGFSSYILPCLLLGLCVSSSMALVLRNNLVSALESEYVKFARLRGISEGRVVLKHALRNSFSTVLSLSSFIFANLITGSIVIESVFAWPGVGQLSYRAIIERDFPLVQGIVIVFAVMIIALSFIVDVLHSLLDPRIRLAGRGEAL